MLTDEKSIFAPNERWGLFLFFLILLSGFGVRMYDLKDPPLDFAATRQLRSAMIARGKYYQIAEDVQEWKKEVAIKNGGHSMIEPTIMETIVAYTYLLIGEEQLWIARIYSSFFWCLAGIGLFFLVREAVSVDGAYVALTYYLFNPFGIVASRSFQPDPLMVSLIIFSWWAFYKWFKLSDWKWAILAGLSSGAAMLVKSTAVFFLLGGMAVLAILKKNIGKIIRDAQVWLIALLAGLPVLIYHVYGVFFVGTLGKQFRGRFFPGMLVEMDYYRSLKNALIAVAAHELILILGLIGLIYFVGKKDFGFLLGIWLGYGLLSVVFTYHSTTHYYYHLPAIPLLAISLAGTAELIFSWIQHLKIKVFFQIGLVLLVVLGVGGGHYLLFQDDYRNEPYFYHKVANFVPQDSRKIVLSQDYGNRIDYFGWISSKPWSDPGNIDYAQPYSENKKVYGKGFKEITSRFDYFIITRLRVFRNNTYLYRHLHENYPVFKEGGGYIIFDLTRIKDS